MAAPKTVKTTKRSVVKKPGKGKVKTHAEARSVEEYEQGYKEGYKVGWKEGLVKGFYDGFDRMYASDES